VSCAGAGSVDLTAGTSTRLSTPKRLARVARLLPRPCRRVGDRIPPRRTSPRSRSDCGRFRSTLLWILRSHAGRPLRPFRQARRREPAVVCQQPPVVGITQFGDRRQSRPTQSTRLSKPWQRSSPSNLLGVGAPASSSRRLHTRAHRIGSPAANARRRRLAPTKRSSQAPDIGVVVLAAGGSSRHMTEAPLSPGQSSSKDA
jgi:hypothetical protein